MIPPETVSTENREASSSDHSLNRSLHNSLQEKSRKRKLRTKLTKQTSTITFSNRIPRAPRSKEMKIIIKFIKTRSVLVVLVPVYGKTEHKKAKMRSINNPCEETRKQTKEEAIRTLCEESWREVEERGRRKESIADTARRCYVHLLQLQPHQRSHCRSSWLP